MARKRHLSRIAALQTLFQQEVRGGSAFDMLERIGTELGEIDTEFALTLLSGVEEHMENIKGVIEKNAPGWTWKKIDPIARCTLLIGTYELLHGNDAPPAVVMNEAIEIAKEYGTEETGKFVNGVLNAVAKNG